ncbi:hypothetical protein XaFJ1_GM002375 [Xanthomonas albilineans]|nr:hypothetical protein XaFJ1_GM002375 [Xanthomonas albilineans]
MIKEMQSMMLRIAKQAKSGIERINENGDAAINRDVGATHFRPARHRNVKFVGKTFQVRGSAIIDMMLEYAE